MKTILSTVVLLASLGLCRGGTTIDNNNFGAYGANVAWLNWRADAINGAVIGAYVCSGNIYAANVGWINLGSGAPTNQIYYQNLSPVDFGVNQDGQGNLRGWAYGANIGWVAFESNGAPKVDLQTGTFSGYVYSANCGWISLTNAQAVVQTDTIAKGVDSDGHGLPNAWQMMYFGHLGVDPNADPDGDGASNLEEYLAGTNPLDNTDFLRITSQSCVFGPGSTTVSLTWRSEPTRQYFIMGTSALSPSAWLDCGLGLISPDGTSTTRSFTESRATSRFYCVKAVRPLDP
jgi:hypothetical protein